MSAETKRKPSPEPGAKPARGYHQAPNNAQAFAAWKAKQQATLKH